MNSGFQYRSLIIINYLCSEKTIKQEETVIRTWLAYRIQRLSTNLSTPIVNNDLANAIYLYPRTKPNACGLNLICCHKAHRNFQQVSLLQPLFQGSRTAEESEQKGGGGKDKKWLKHDLTRRIISGQLLLRQLLGSVSNSIFL